jgi:hypothetical protein
LRRRALRNGLKDEDVRKTSNSVEDNAWDGHRTLQIGVENDAGAQGVGCPRCAAEVPREFLGEKKIRAVSERIESVGGFPNRLISA